MEDALYKMGFGVLQVLLLGELSVINQMYKYLSWDLACIIYDTFAACNEVSHAEY